MNMIQRFMLVFVSMFAISASMTVVMNKDMFYHVNQMELYIYTILGLIVLIYQTILIMREATRKQIVIIENERLREKMSNIGENKESEEL